MVFVVFWPLIFDKGRDLNSKSLEMILFKQSTVEVEAIADYFVVHTSIFTIKVPLRALEAKSVLHLVKL